MKQHPGYIEFRPVDDYWQPTREEIAMKAAERKPSPLRITDEDIQRYLDNIRSVEKGRHR